MNDDLRSRVKQIQSAMVESAKSCFDESELGHLRCVIRLTVEFRHYLEQGSTEAARGILQTPYVELTSEEFQKDLQSSSTDPFNKYDRQFICESIRSGVDSFCCLNATYGILVGATDSTVKWGVISSMDSFRAQFISMFDRFTQEEHFENKCRLLLDLFKLQIVFAGISYD